jgi:hypothetical protein
MKLPPEIEETLAQDLRDGIFFKMSRHEPGQRRKATEIHWRPGDRNALAEAIIAKVQEQDVLLDLNGHAYWIRKKL